MSLADRLCEQYVLRHPAEAARLLETLPLADQTALLATLAPPASALLLASTLARSAAAAIEHLPHPRAAEILGKMHTGTAVELLRQLSADNLSAVLGGMDTDVRETVEELLAHAPDSVGELADTRALVLPDDIPVRQALRRVRDAEHVLNVLPVLDRSRRLVGTTTVHELLSANWQQPVGRVAKADPPSIRMHEPQSASLYHRGWRELPDLPVVDAEGRYVGCVPYSVVARLRERHKLERRDSTLDTLLTLGEAYWRGLAGLVDDVGSSHGRRETRRAAGK